MANIDLAKYGITGTTEIVYNPSYEDLIAQGFLRQIKFIVTVLVKRYTWILGKII